MKTVLQFLMLCLFIFCGCTVTGPRQEGQVAIDSKVYQQLQLCHAFYETCRENCCKAYECREANADLRDTCQDPFGSESLVTLGPPSLAESARELSQSRLKHIVVENALAELAELAALNYLIDTSKNTIVKGTIFETYWSSALTQLIRAGAFSVTSSCNALAIGRTDVLVQIPFSSWIEVEGLKVVPGDCSSHYTGRRWDFDFRNIPLEDAFAQLAAISNLNFILDPEVKGSVTGHFRKVPWDEVQDLLQATFGLATIQDKNIVRVGKASTIQEELERRAIVSCTCCS